MGLEPTTPCLQSRTRGFADQVFCTSSQVRGRFSSTLLRTVVPCWAMECGLCVDSVGVQGTPTAPVWRHSGTSITHRASEAWHGPNTARLNSRRVGGTPPWVTVIYWVRGGRYPTAPPRRLGKSDATAAVTVLSGSSDRGGRERRKASGGRLPCTRRGPSEEAPAGGVNPLVVLRPPKRGSRNPAPDLEPASASTSLMLSPCASPTRRSTCNGRGAPGGSSWPAFERASAARASGPDTTARQGVRHPAGHIQRTAPRPTSELCALADAPQHRDVISSRPCVRSRVDLRATGPGALVRPAQPTPSESCSDQSPPA
jgi:hypothetical protein